MGFTNIPPQALLDMMTIRQKFGRLGAKVAIIGDIFHSRVARSNAWGMTTMGMNVVLYGPPTLLPQHRKVLVFRLLTGWMKLLMVLMLSCCFDCNWNVRQVEHSRQFGSTESATGWISKTLIII